MYMKNRKRRFVNFNLYDYQGVEEHLSAMAAKGWRLEKAGNQLWTYRRAEPAKVRYAVTYSYDLSQFDPGPTEGQARLEDLCAAAGWEKVSGWLQMQIFSTEAENPVPLETDEALRLENIHRTVKRHFYPPHLLLLVLSLFMTASFINSIIRTPVRVFGSSSRLFAGPLYIILTVLLLVNLGSYWLWRRRSLRSVEAGGACVRLGPGCRRTAWVSLALVLLLSAGYALSSLLGSQKIYGVYFLVYLVLFTLLVLAVHGTKNHLKRRGVSRGKNMAATLTVDIVLAFALVGGLTWSAMHFGWFTGGEGETYSYQNYTWDADPIDIPLTAADLTGQPVQHTRRDTMQDGTVFLSNQQYWETALVDGDLYVLSYELRDVRAGWLYEPLLEELLGTEKRTGIPLMERRYVQEDASPWGAEAAWRQYWNETPGDSWLLCWPDRIVSIRLDNIPPTAEEMARVGTLLGPA